MLADPRARTALVENFFSQWLQVRNVWLLTPDANRRFPWFDDNLRTAFVRETELFLESQLQEDRSVVELLTADYTFLNEQLAQHYGIRDVYGSHFRRVTLADQNRWGLLGKASILSMTSYPHRTSPTIRGKWLLENILAAPVPPPPPDVNTNLDESEDVKTSSVREMLEQHRANPGCASCHARHGSAGLQPRELRRPRPVAHEGRRVADRRVGRAARRHESRWPGGASGRAAAEERPVREGGDRQAADVRGRPRDGSPRRAGDSRDRARGRRRRLPLVVDDSGDREEHAVSDAAPKQIDDAAKAEPQRGDGTAAGPAQCKDEVAVHDRRPRRPFRAARCFAASASTLVAAAARRDGAGADGVAEHAGEARAPPWRRVSPERRRLRELAAEGCRRRFRVLARALAARAVPRSRQSSSPGSPIARRKRSATAAATTRARRARI